MRTGINPTHSRSTRLDSAGGAEGLSSQIARRTRLLAHGILLAGHLPERGTDRAAGYMRAAATVPDYSGAKPDKAIHAYRVEMDVNYDPGDHPIVFHVTTNRQELPPWQAYASYELTGGFVLYGHCGDGFVVDKVFGTPQANPSHFDDPRTLGDMAAFNPENAAASGKKNLHLGYTCVREP